MEEQQLLHQVLDASRSFNDKCPGIPGRSKCKKFGGAVTVEILRRFLRRNGFPVSARDVYINGLPVEIDLLIPKRRAAPKYGILYEPEQVACVLEVKKSGTFGANDVKKIKKDFRMVRRVARIIRCAYITLEERETYRHRATDGNIGSPCYSLFWHSGSRNVIKEKTGDWNRFLAFLRESTRSV
jgi:hypothetical protein